MLRCMDRSEWLVFGFQAEMVMDDNGTSEDLSDDMEISFQTLKVSGHDDLVGRDLCEDIESFLS